MKKFSFLSKIILIILLFSLTKSQNEKKKKKEIRTNRFSINNNPNKFL